MGLSITVEVRAARGVPLDQVKPEHAWIDDRLNSWGRWARARGGKRTCGSVEGNYRAPWRQWHYPSIAELMPPLPAPEIRLIDRAVLHVPEDHRAAIRFHYAFMTPAFIICRKLKLRPVAFSDFMTTARTMTLNNLRRLQHERQTED